MTAPIRFGIVGTSRMAARMLRTLRLRSDLQVAGVASEAPQRARDFAAAFGIATAHDGLDALLADGGIDAVYIANATARHAHSAAAALLAGKAVLCEKPVATSAAEAAQIEAAVQRSGGLFMEAMWTPFLPAQQRLLALARGTGQPAGDRLQWQHLQADFGYPLPASELARLRPQRAAGGVLLDRGIYPVSLALDLFGPVRRVQAQVDVVDGFDEHALLQLEHANGCRSQLAASMRCLLQNRAVLSAGGGLLALEPPSVGSETLRIDLRAPQAAADALAPAGLKGRLKAALWQRPAVRRLSRARAAWKTEHLPFGADQYLPMLDHFCQLLATRQAASPVRPLAASIAALQVIDEARAQAAAAAPEGPR